MMVWHERFARRVAECSARRAKAGSERALNYIVGQGIKRPGARPALARYIIWSGPRWTSFRAMVRGGGEQGMRKLQGISFFFPSSLFVVILK